MYLLTRSLTHSLICVAILCRRDVVHRAGNTSHVATPPDADRATAVGSIQWNVGEVWAYGFWDMFGRHTDTQVIAIFCTKLVMKKRSDQIEGRLVRVYCYHRRATAVNRVVAIRCSEWADCRRMAMNVLFTQRQSQCKANQAAACSNRTPKMTFITDHFVVQVLHSVCCVCMCIHTMNIKGNDFLWPGYFSCYGCIYCVIL